MRILATDLDRTLLPNGSWPPDPGAIDLFNELTQKHDVLVVYVTGRNLDLTEKAIREFGIRYPDVLIGDVGTSIRNSPRASVAAVARARSSATSASIRSHSALRPVSRRVSASLIVARRVRG